MTNDIATDLFSSYPDRSDVAASPEWQAAVCVVTEDDLIAEAQQAYLTLKGQALTDALDAIIMRAMDTDDSDHVLQHRLNQAIQIAHGAYHDLITPSIRDMVPLPDQDGPPSPEEVVTDAMIVDDTDALSEFERAKTDPLISLPELPPEFVILEE
jgi:hypothetical protein